METKGKTSITIETTVNVPVDKVWTIWNEPKHIMQWCTASEDWQTTNSKNDLKAGGKFSSTMGAKDGSFSFDFEGTYTKVEKNKVIEYDIADGRKVKVIFTSEGNKTKVVETFDAEDQNPVEMQRGGWQAILDNFKKYTEANS
jgi:uncharacterized protein YndB with AHSA1/START domain